ncbi:MAG: HTH domain-containing protein [Bacteroidaceae bacterium]|nr:HTH domain-containing protein [Bacteroidaceae bacterium]
MLLHATPSLTAQEISVRMDLTLRGVEKQIKRLKDAGVISRQGSRKTGFWSINK